MTLHASDTTVTPGTMQDTPLTIAMLLDPMEQRLARKTVTTWHDTPGGERTSSVASYAEVARRARQLGAALDGLGVPKGARVASFAWNDQEHLELFIGVPASGRILHTVNHRLFPRQLDYILRHADDRAVFVEFSMLESLWPVLAAIPSLQHVVVLDQSGAAALPDDSRIVRYEDLLAAQTKLHPLDHADELSTASLCYTSGTTGDPKGVAYSHRSVMLHALLLLTVDGFGIREDDVVMPVVPMFHVNAWGLPYACVLAGAHLSLPGASPRPAHLARQLATDRVTMTGAVPTIWRDLLPHVRDLELDLTSLRLAVCGGGPMPGDLAASYDKLGITLRGAWGMTETSPLVTVARDTWDDLGKTADERRGTYAAAGRPVPLVSVRILDDDGLAAVWDGMTVGELQVRGATIVSRYHGSTTSALTPDGWFPTGDVATIDATGLVKIVDRKKDLIKSGGEWISSVELENALLSHPDVREAAVVPKADDRWGERPVAWVSSVQGVDLDVEAVREHLATRVASWWVPQDIRVLDELPKTGTGKWAKATLRQLSEDLPQDPVEEQP